MKATILRYAGVAGALILTGGMATSAQAQYITYTELLDASAANTGAVYASTYNPAEDVFLASRAAGDPLIADVVRIYDGSNGTYTGDLNTTGITAAGLGFFAMASGSDSSFFIYNNNGDIFQWDNAADTPTLAVSAAAFARTGTVIGSGTDTALAMTGATTNGDIQVFTTADDVSYALSETIPGAAAMAKSALAINASLDETWAIGDVGYAIKKAVKVDGTWEADATFVAPAGTNGAPGLAYDDVNNILFAAAGTTLWALDATTGDVIPVGEVDPEDSQTLQNGFSTVTGYGGGIVFNATAGAGTVALVGRSATTDNVVMQKWSYVYTAPTAVDDWSMY